MKSGETNTPAGSTSGSGGLSYLYMAAAFVIVVAGMRAAESILNPLLLAVFLSIISAPAYFRLLKRGVANWLALLTVVGVLSVTVISLVVVTMGSIASFTGQLSQYQQQLQRERRHMEHRLEAWFPEPAEETSPESEEPSKDAKETQDENATAPETVNLPEDAAARAAEDLSKAVQTTTEVSAPEITKRFWQLFDPAWVMSSAAAVVTSIGGLLSNAVLILLIVIFILLEAGTFDRKLRDSLDRSEEARQRADQIIGSVHHYIRIKTWVSLVTGMLVWGWLWAWNVSHSPLWGLFAFLMNYIPNIGSFLAAIPALLVAWLELGGLPTLAILCGYIAINGGIGNFVEPRLMGKSLGLSPLVVFFSMLFWGWVLGPTGMLLSVPLTMTARIAMDGFEDTRWLATLMGNPH